MIQLSLSHSLIERNIYTRVQAATPTLIISDLRGGYSIPGERRAEGKIQVGGVSKKRRHRAADEPQHLHFRHTVLGIALGELLGGVNASVESRFLLFSWSGSGCRIAIKAEHYRDNK